MNPKKKIIVAGMTGILLIGAGWGLAGCSSALNTLSSSISDKVTGSAGSDMVSSEVDSSANTAAQGINGSVTVTSTWISSTVSDPRVAAEQASSIATEAGGYVESRTEGTGYGLMPLGAPSSSTNDAVTSITMVLRVPTAEMDTVLAEIRAIGHETSFNQTMYDATADKVSLDAQIRTLTDSLASLRQLQSQATNVTDLLAAEDAISARQSNLDGLIAQRDYLASQVEMTAISIDFTAQTSSTVTNQNFGDGVVNGWNALMATGGVLLVVLGFLLPWLAVLVVMGGIALAITIPLVRRARRRHEQTPP